MTLQDLLNADLKVIGRGLRQGWTWWLRELADLIPASWKDQRTSRTPWLAEMTTEDGPVQLWRDGAPDRLIAAGDGVSRAADLALPPGSVLVRELDLPRVSRSSLDRLLNLNIDRFIPFQPEQVYFDVRILSDTEAGPKQRVRLGVVARDRAAAALARAGALGLAVEHMGVREGNAAQGLQFDFMPAIRAQDGGDPLNRRRTWLWAGCAALLVLNVAVAVFRDVDGVAQLQRLVDLQQPTVALAARLRSRVEAEQARRLTLLARRSVHEPLRILDAVTRALPRTAWVQRLEWNGRAVRLVGLRAGDADVTAALHGPALRNPRSLLSDMSTRTTTGQVPYDVMADSTAQAPQ